MNSALPGGGERYLNLHGLGVDGFDDFFGGGPAGHGFGFSVFKHGSVALSAGGFYHA